MRLYPAGGVASFRRIQTGKDLVLGGGKLVVPAGVALHFPITAVHHSRAVWEDPEAFSPERFLEVCPATCVLDEARCAVSAALGWEPAQAAASVTQHVGGRSKHQNHARTMVPAHSVR